MSVTVPRPTRDNRDLGFYALKEIVGRGILRTMMRHLQHRRLEIEIFRQQAMFGLVFSIAGKQHRERSVIQPGNDRIGVWFVAAAFHLYLRKERFGRRKNG